MMIPASCNVGDKSEFLFVLARPSLLLAPHLSQNMVMVMVVMVMMVMETMVMVMMLMIIIVMAMRVVVMMEMVMLMLRYHLTCLRLLVETAALIDRLSPEKAVH